MGKRYDHLTAEDRKLIARLHEDKIPVTVIAVQLGRHKSTIHRELLRNRTDDGPWLRGYFGMAAHQISAMRRRRSAKLLRDPALAAHVIARLKDGWSPQPATSRCEQIEKFRPLFLGQHPPCRRSTSESGALLGVCPEAGAAAAKARTASPRAAPLAVTILRPGGGTRRSPDAPSRRAGRSAAMRN